MSSFQDALQSGRFAVTAELNPPKGMELAGRLIQEVRGLAAGVHIMAIGWERHIPQVLEASGVLPAVRSAQP